MATIERLPERVILHVTTDQLLALSRLNTRCMVWDRYDETAWIAGCRDILGQDVTEALIATPYQQIQITADQ